MRIKALSKKLNLPVAEIGRVLQLNSSENTLVNLKLTDEEVLKVLQTLGKTMEDLDKLDEGIEDENTLVEEIVTHNNIVVETPIAEVLQQKEDEQKNNTEHPIVENKKLEKKQSNVEIVDTGETTLHIVDGVIKAPKVELQGLTIKGKIDLPEKKAPEVVETKSEENTDNSTKVIPVYQPKPKVKKENKSIEDLKEKNKQKQETLAAKKALEIKRLQEIESKRKAIIEEQKKAHYFENVVAKTQPVKKQNKKKSDKKSVQNPIVEPKLNVSSPKKTNQPKGLWGKFKAWLNGE
jgi:hypothetical protein